MSRAALKLQVTAWWLTAELALPGGLNPGDRPARLPAMPSETEPLAIQLVRALSDAPDGRPMQWRMIEHLDGATADVVEFAAARLCGTLNRIEDRAPRWQ